ncbi:hypothetical protein BDV95DRAFT_553174 [Massariosphaeria phaeospora]|uniref:Peptidyl-tRNA hydrolase n=1 Tax=Massariosphaeria phaeospora TaxID=100035 RepID=A0A7C8HZC1_9PLEO|nr:hypothetical protein BDV95DRAFT_553174 [Massariosphaeria phaeospora]
MRFTSPILLALPALALAEQQVPLVDKIKGLWNKVSDSVSSAVPAAPSPLHTAAAKAAEHIQHELTVENWKEVLTVDPTVSAPTTQDWLVYITGGNSTCFGLCGNTTKAWNTSLPALAARSSTPKFAIVDCDAEPILCNSWSIAPPSLYYFQIPKPLADQSAPTPSVRYFPLNRTSTTVETFKTLVVDREFEKKDPYEGFWHPFNGPLQQYGVAYYAGYAIWAFSLMPTWLPMILISFLSRQFMGRRAAATQPQRGAAPPAQ